MSGDWRLGITNLVNHHDCKQIADGCKEQAIEIVLDSVADGVAEDIQNDLSNDEEENAKNNVTHRPAVLEGADNENDLADEIDEEEDGVDKVGNDEDADWVLSIQARPVLEGQKRNGAANDEHGQGSQAQQPDRQGGSILIQLKTNESVNQQASAKGRDESVLGGGKVWIGGGARCSNAGVENERYDGQEEVNVEKGRNLFATCVGVSVGGLVLSADSGDSIPTAVNLDRTWNIMITVMTRARMCMKSFATWKISVFATSITEQTATEFGSRPIVVRCAHADDAVTLDCLPDARLDYRLHVSGSSTHSSLCRPRLASGTQSSWSVDLPWGSLGRRGGGGLTIRSLASEHGAFSVVLRAGPGCGFRVGDHECSHVAITSLLTTSASTLAIVVKAAARLLLLFFQHARSQLLPSVTWPLPRHIVSILASSNALTLHFFHQSLCHLSRSCCHVTLPHSVFATHNMENDGYYGPDLQGREVNVDYLQYCPSVVDVHVQLQLFMRRIVDLAGEPFRDHEHGHRAALTLVLMNDTGINLSVMPRPPNVTMFDVLLWFADIAATIIIVTPGLWSDGEHGSASHVSASTERLHDSNDYPSRASASTERLTSPNVKLTNLSASIKRLYNSNNYPSYASASIERLTSPNVKLTNLSASAKRLYNSDNYPSRASASTERLTGPDVKLTNLSASAKRLLDSDEQPNLPAKRNNVDGHDQNQSARIGGPSAPADVGLGREYPKLNLHVRLAFDYARTLTYRPLLHVSGATQNKTTTSDRLIQWFSSPATLKRKPTVYKYFSNAWRKGHDSVSYSTKQEAFASDTVLRHVPASTERLASLDDQLNPPAKFTKDDQDTSK
ncbi:hypothetical protein OPT61_g3818 [Boeremia exigua]|uniref:Uncharacterized protein n=1 Tax=Boeremia exigua TaxID=749465 RepID=A0ACC2IGB1_9PLEO|nr:hypothetical protein OPT61_g3818 [Boeremia exigua]